ncbi:Maf family protein [Alteromonadaceae bacterium BrNp21-10]|nr:Maf family protein [Alteromonadaceae bacterium BrNp21-10]
MILLASQSPRRAMLLQQLSVPFEVVNIEFDETPLENENAECYVLRMAEGKALQGVASTDSSLPVLGADTSVVDELGILGKPNNKADAVAMLKRLSNKPHQVLTAIAIADKNGVKSQLISTTVYFKALLDAEIDWYWYTGEPADKAGSYGIQGLGGQFVTHIHGSYSAVVGLPLYETAMLLNAVGINLHER